MHQMQRIRSDVPSSTFSLSTSNPSTILTSNLIPAYSSLPHPTLTFESILFYLSLTRAAPRSAPGR